MSSQIAAETESLYVSYGIILLNNKDEVLVVKRWFSYGFSSLFSMLLLKDTTAELPDQFIKICRELIQELTPEEFKLLKSNWSPQGLQKLLDHYLKGLPDEFLRFRVGNEFQEDWVKAECLWGHLIRGVQLPEELLKDRSRIHDLPKGRRCKTVAEIHRQVVFETGIRLPNNLEYGGWQTVSYTSNTGISYQICLISARCSNLKINSSRCEWRKPETVKMHNKLASAVINSINGY